MANTGFREASFIEGRLMRIAKKKVEILVDDEETGEASLIAIKLADGVNISLDTVGENIKAVIVDGKVALITPLTVGPQGTGPSEVGSSD